MKRILGIAAILAPAIASAQSADPNYDPNAAPAQQPQPAPQQPPPVTANTTNTTSPPVIVVNPNQAQPPPPAPTYTEPEGNVVYDNWNAPVFTTGAIVFGASYAAAAIASSESDHPGADRLWVPVVGPWLALNDWGDCPISQARCDNNTTDKVLLVADGVFQAAGLITMLDGVLSPTSHRVVTRTVDTKVHVKPTGSGFTVFGHF